MFDTSDEWIVERTGIHERHVGGTTTGLSIESGRKALDMSGVDPASDRRAGAGHHHARPHRARVVAAASRTSSACAAARSTSTRRAPGFIYGLVMAHGLIAMGAQQGAAASAPTRCRGSPTGPIATPPSCSPTAPAPWCSRPCDGPGQLLGWDLDADGSAERFLYAEVGGFIQMEGKEVFRRAVRIMVDSATKSMNHAGVTADDIALVVPHQANIRIIQAACERLGIPMERTATVLHNTGNTSSASIPLALCDALDDGPGQRRRSRAARRLRRRHDGRQRRAALGRRRPVSRERSSSSPAERAASAWPARSASPRSATRSPSPTTPRRRPTACSA